MKTRPVYVAGFETLTSLGDDRERSWEPLCRGVSGIRRVDRFPSEFIPAKIAASVESFPGLNCEQRCAEMALSTLNSVLSETRLAPEERGEIGLYCALGLLAMDWPGFLQLAATSDPSEKRRLFPEMIMKNECAAATVEKLANSVGTRRLPMLVNTACASGATAIQLAAEAIRTGADDLALVVGSDASLHEEVLTRFSLLSALSTANEPPERAMRPFSKRRDGFVLGEGAATLLLASEAALKRWNLVPLARISGMGDATDNFHRTRSSPDGKAIIQAMSNALRDAGLKPEDIDYVNAHGTSTVENDKMECAGICEVFGGAVDGLWVTSNKSMIGHTLLAAGAIEASLSIMSIIKGVIPPTINYDEPDETLGVKVPTEAVRKPVRHVLSNSFGFGGQNVSLVLSAV